jgi:hypothetical protein
MQGYDSFSFLCKYYRKETQLCDFCQSPAKNYLIEKQGIISFKGKSGMKKGGPPRMKVFLKMYMKIKGKKIAPGYF